jgi:Core-2/I-Branching enzyme
VKIAVLILAHKNPEQVKRLVQRLEHPDVSVFIHADKKSSFERNSFPGNTTFITENVSVYWGDFSPVQATLTGMKEIKESAIKFDYFLLLSGQDYPITSIKKLLDFFKENNGKEYINYTPVNKDGWKEAMNRYQYYHYRRNKNIFLWAIFAKLRLLMKMTGLKRNPPLPLWAGSQWFNISYAAFNYILDYNAGHPGYTRFMKRCNFTDEMFFQTILLNSPFKNDCINDNLRFIDWDENVVKKIKSPKILTIKDKETIQHSKALFARKFDITIDKNILDVLDSLLISTH